MIGWTWGISGISIHFVGPILRVNWEGRRGNIWAITARRKGRAKYLLYYSY
jgi:hypothetical protein